MGKCQRLLDRGNSPYAQLLATTTITKMISRSTQSLNLAQRIHIRNYVLTYLWSQVTHLDESFNFLVCYCDVTPNDVLQPKLPQFVVQGLVSLFSRITKLGWFDSEKEEFVFRAVITDVTKFLQGSAEHCMVGVQLLSQLTCEMNQVLSLIAVSNPDCIALLCTALY